MTHGSLFSGIGGFDLAAEWAGWENKFHCEISPFGQKVLKHYWPEAELFTDIKTTDFSKYAKTIDIISGGFPCQPYSQAGSRKGKADERHLWPYMLGAIKQIQPRWVVGENVLGLVNWSGGLVFHEVQTDLEAAGTKFGRMYFHLVALTHRTEGIGFGLLPTPTTQEPTTEAELSETGRRKTKDGKASHSLNLGRVAGMGMLQTPSAMGFNKTNQELFVTSSGTVRSKYTETQTSQVGLGQQLNYLTGNNGQLNPRFVANMMGFPKDWLELPFKAT